jgi:hypothetical protein
MKKVIPKQGLLIFFVVTIGSLFRFSHLFFINLNEPFQFGGLFWEFSRQIRLNHYLLPVTIPYYSSGGIPFAYPPLPFYFEALITDLFHVSPYWIVNILPAFISALCLPSFYLMARRITASDRAALIALLVYIFVPNSFLNQIQGGGLAESSGSLALIWFGYSLAGFYAKNSLKNAAFAGVFLGICVLASPGSALAGAVVASIFALAILLRDRHGARRVKTALFSQISRLALIGVVGMAVSVPYWLTVMSNHGRGIFFTSVAGQLQGENDPFLFRALKDLISLNISGGGYPFLWNVLFFAGLFWAIFNRRWLLTALFFALFLIPGEGEWIIPILAAVLAGSALSEWLVPYFGQLLQPYAQRKLLAGTMLIVLCVGLLYASYDALREMIYDNQARITADQISDLEQARQVIPPNANVVVFGTDAVLEWSPTLLQRDVLNVKYGLEWQPSKLARVQALYKALKESTGWSEMLQVLKTFGFDGDVYLVGDKRRFSGLSRASGAAANMFVSLKDFSFFEVGVLSPAAQ